MRVRRLVVGSRRGSRESTVSVALRVSTRRDGRSRVRPAAHYHMGGIATDAFGRSSLSGLWAVGECATTGLHGANRLASNSLLEAVVMAQRVARDLAGRPATAQQPCRDVPRLTPSADPETVRSVVSNALGVIRNGDAMRAAINALLPIAKGNGPGADPAIVALAVAVFAYLRQESRGAHFRTDFPDTLPQSPPVG